MGELTTADSWLLVALPLGAFVVQALFHNFLWRKGDWVGVLTMLAVWLLALALVAVGLDNYPDNLPGVRSWEWMRSGDYELRLGFFLDEITMVMLVVVTTVALMVNIYSLGYMKGEARYGWFFAVLQLFVFSMLLLVLADSLLMLFVAWELVGVCSYFLIGFYFERRSAVEAAKKAFVTNRVGDVGLMIGIIMLWRVTGTFDIQTIIEQAEAGAISKTYLTVAMGFMLLGPIAKSAQVPLHVWLPDAMEGPTPVSALIHAATMVVAGIYLVARMLPVFEATDYLMTTILIVGTVTALFGAFVALTQIDVKRVIAYSTIANLGFMMMALGAGAVGAAMFHLMTHAFFKACLFLGAGSIIHSTGHQDMDKLGGLRKYMPITFVTFLIAAFANAGIPPLAGFFSKDEVLHALETDVNIIFFLLAILWVFVSGCYTIRMLIYTFGGRYRGLDQPVTEDESAEVAAQALHHASPEPPVTAAAAEGLVREPAAAVAGGHAGVIALATDDHGAHDAHAGGHDAHAGGHGGGHGHGGGIPHESPLTMTVPLIILAVLAIFAGFPIYENVGRAIGLPHGFAGFLDPEHADEIFKLDYLLAAIGTLGGLAGLFFGGYLLMQPGRMARFTASIPELYRLVSNKFYIDQLYQYIIDKIVLAFSGALALFDRKVVNDTGVDGPSYLTSYFGKRLKYIQTGKLPNYAFVIVAGIIVLAVVAYSTRT